MGKHRFDPCERTRHEFTTFWTKPDPTSVELTCCSFCGVWPDGKWIAPGLVSGATWPNIRASSAVRIE